MTCTTLFTDGAVLNASWWYHVVNFLHFKSVDVELTRQRIEMLSLFVRMKIEEYPGQKCIHWFVAYIPKSKITPKNTVFYAILNNTFEGNYSQLLDTVFGQDEWQHGKNFFYSP